MTGQTEGRALSGDEIRALMAKERERVLSELVKAEKRDTAARAKEVARRERLHTLTKALLIEGKGLGIPVIDMAEAAGLTRQMAHRLIREAELDQDPRGGRDA